MHRFLRRSQLGLTTLAAFTGCMAWTPLKPSGDGVAPVVSVKHAVRVTRHDGGVFTLEKPSIVGDSLIGLVGNPPDRSATVWREVRRLETLRVSPLLTGTTLVLLGVIVSIASSIGPFADLILR